jgi:hypothetical protein
MFVKGSLDAYDPQTGRFVAMASDKNFKWETQYRVCRRTYIECSWETANFFCLSI